MIYARFIDPAPGQENAAGNCIEGPQTFPPWPGSYASTARKAEYAAAGWRWDLADDWTPASALPTKVEQIRALNEEFDPQRRQLLEYITTAREVCQDGELVAELVGEFEQLSIDYQNRMAVINNG